jgi:cell division protein ZapA (FtsZ GTPase activity inhibitor)
MAASPRPVTEIQIGGTAYRVQSSADAAELGRLVDVVESRLAELPSNQRQGSRSLVLVALSLAHDLEQLRREHTDLRAQVVERLTGLVSRVDEALDHRDENGDLLPPIPQAASANSESSDAVVEPTSAEGVPAPSPALPAIDPASRATVPRRSRPTPVRRETSEPT